LAPRAETQIRLHFLNPSGAPTRWSDRIEQSAEIRIGVQRKQGGQVNAAAGPIRLLSIVLTAIVAISFTLFVWDELGSASKNQAQLASKNGEQIALTRDLHGRLLASENSKLRVNIDKANDAITSPGEQIGKKVGNTNEWALRGLAFLFGIIVFLIGLRLLASWLEMNGSPSGQVTARNPQDAYTSGSR
jgi:predicted PurR-regulated permease PerM